MRRLLFVLLVLPGLAAAQHPAESLRARLGDAIEPEEQAYFGLFYPLDARFRGATYAPQGDSLRFHLTLADTAGAALDSTVVLDAPTAQMLARYVDEYETLFAGDGLVPRRRAYGALLRMQVARPAPGYRPGAPVRVVRRDGSRVEGTLLWADAQRLALQPPRTPFDWRRPGEVVLIAPSEIGHVELAGWPDAAVTGATALVLMASQAVVPLYSGDAAPALDALRTAATATGVVVLRERPRSRLDVQGRRADYARALPRLVGLSRYAALRPPELAATAPPEGPPHAPEKVRRPPRPYVSLMITHENEAPVGNGYTVAAQYAPAHPAAPGGQALTEVTPRIHRAGLYGEATFHVLPWLGIGVEGARHRSLRPREGTDEALGTTLFYGASVRARRRVQETPVGSAWLSVGVGLRRVTASLRGVFLVTAAARPEAPPPNVYATYEARGERLQPTAHVGYDVAVGRHASIYAGVNAALPLELRVPAQTSTFEHATGRYQATMPAHKTGVGAVRYRLGIRLHL